MHGSCNCGAVTVEANIPSDAKPDVFVCHCRNCKKSSGAGGAFAMVVALSDLAFSGPIKQFADKNTNAGRTVHRSFCEVCGSPIYGLFETLPGLALVRITLFDEFNNAPPAPGVEFYAKDRWEWDHELPGSQQLLTQ